MKQNKGVSMITLIITIIVIIILAAIAFVGMDDATGSAQYAKFANEFGDYATNFNGTAVAKVQESLGLAGKVANKAQIVYCAARGVNLSEFSEVLNGVTTPGGYTSTRFQTDIKDATGAKYVLASANTPVYEIKDNVMSNYTGKKFYGDANGQETHWVTATGVVFTLPGYPRVVDGEERMYINAELYYVPGESGNAGEGAGVGNSFNVLLANGLVGLEPVKLAGDVNVGNQQYTDAADHVGASGEEVQQGALLAETVEIGDYVDYPVLYTNVSDQYGHISSYTGWRVIKKEGNTVSLVSAGVPLTFYHPYEMSGAYTSTKALKEDFLSTIFTTSGNRGYIKNGFDSTNLENVFSNNYTSEVRSMTKEDVESVGEYVGNTGGLGRVSEGPGEWADDKYDNLFLLATNNSSIYYWLATPNSEELLYHITADCNLGAMLVSAYYNKEYGVRPVVTLKSDVRVTATNSGDGSESNPWNLAPVE